MKFKKLLLAAPVAAALVACGNTSYQPSYQPAYVAPQAYQICIGPNGLRVNDLLCDTPHAGYFPDYYSGSSVLLPAIGYAPSGSGWSRQRPNVTNITIHNHEPAAGGRVTADPKPPVKTPPSQASKPLSTAKKASPPPPPAPKANSSITRGGLGVKKK